jgi:hypothetical protein
VGNLAIASKGSLFYIIKNKKMKKETITFIGLIALSLGLSLGLLLSITSCSSTGYGCKGRSSLITRVK